MEYNGSAIMAMKGKNCVAIAADRRFGVQALTLGTDFQKIFQINNSTFIGLAGLATDVQTLNELFRYKTNMYKLNQERDISPKTFGHLVSSTLYEKRYYISHAGLAPILQNPSLPGLSPTGPPLYAPWISLDALILPKTLW
jgi:20S proteasome subunit beta 3